MFLKVFRRFREKSAIIFIIALLKGVIIEIIYPIVITWKLYNIPYYTVRERRTSL